MGGPSEPVFLQTAQYLIVSPNTLNALYSKESATDNELMYS